MKQIKLNWREKISVWNMRQYWPKSEGTWENDINNGFDIGRRGKKRRPVGVFMKMALIVLLLFLGISSPSSFHMATCHTSGLLSGINPLLSASFSHHLCGECACKQWHGTASAIVVCFWSFGHSALRIVWTLPPCYHIAPKLPFSCCDVILSCGSPLFYEDANVSMHIMNTDGAQNISSI